MGMRGWMQGRAENAEASTLRTVGEPRIFGRNSRILKISSEGRAETPRGLRAKRVRTRGERREGAAGVGDFHKFSRPSAVSIESSSRLKIRSLYILAQ